MRHAVFATLALSLAACAPDSGPPGPGPGPNPSGQPRLEVVGASEVQIGWQEEVEIGFRYLDANDQPVPGQELSFELLPDGSHLIAMSTVTGEDGVGFARVRGERAGSYDLMASAANVDDAQVVIDVRAMVRGTLDVDVTYMGSRGVRRAEVALFENASCDDVVRSVPSPAAVTSTSVRGTATLDSVALDVPSAVYVLGIDARDHVAAEVCISHTMTMEHETLQAPLNDIPARLGGPYATTETFDVTDGFSNDLDTLLAIMGGLGSADPAMWLVDQIRMAPGTPSWIRSGLSLSITRELVAQMLRDALAGIHLPSEVQETIRFGADVDAAFSGLTLEGELDFAAADEYGVAMGQHRLHHVVVPMSDGTSTTLNRAASADVVITFSDRIEMDEHTFALSFGELVETVINQSLLSRLSGSPATLGELVADQFDCPAIAARIGTGVTQDLANAACTVGVGMLQDRIDTAFRGLFAYDELHLAGDSELVDTDQDYDLETIADGNAHARWTGMSGEMVFDGVFSGRSVTDRANSHPVRDRISGLE
ncbi:MAG: hypothetical protein AB7S26_06715 [Sandaracinaceae bacterium]